MEFLREKPKFIPARIHKNKAFYFFLEYPNSYAVVFNILLIKKTSKGFEHTFKAMPYNAMGKSVLQKYFSKTVFSKVNYYGDYDFSKYSSKSKRLIAVAKR